MNEKHMPHAFRLGALAVALASAFSAQAQELDPERQAAVADATTPLSQVRLGVGYLSDPSRRFGMYSGVRDEGLYLFADVDYVSLDKDSGTWRKVSGRDLGLENRELAVDFYRQGEWRVQFGYGRLTRFEPMVVNTGLAGIGSTSVAINGTAIRPVDLEMSRDQFTAGVEYAFDKTNSLRLRFSHEEKVGARLFGRGTAAANAMEFLAEPIDRTTQTVELSFGHAGRRLQLSGGYYGTLFFNHADRLDVSSATANALSQTTNGVPPFTPMSMPLSNNSHQVFVTGGYNVTPLTRATFKASQTVAQQNETFISVAPATTLAGAPTSLHGRVDTLLGYLDLTSMEIDRLELQANVRYEDRDDKTPEAQYMSAAAPSVGISGVTGFNKPRSWSSLKSKLEAGYQLPAQFKAVGTWEVEQQKRNAPESFRKVNFRTETDESTMRVEIKRSFLDTLSGSVSYHQARRSGSSYLLDTYTNANGSNPATSVNPLLFADRDRAGWKASFDWMPADEWAIHVVHDRASDHYEGMALGPRDGERTFSSVDASYAMSERWRAHLWWSRDDTRADQATRVNPNNPPPGLIGQYWQARLRQLSEGVGVGVQGKTRGGIEAGIDVSFSDQSAEQRLAALSGSAIASLPDYYYRMTEVKAFGVYPLDAKSGLRADYALTDWKTNDWTWTGWQYSDGTTLTQDYSQRVHFVGASYYYRWR